MIKRERCVWLLSIAIIVISGSIVAILYFPNNRKQLADVQGAGAHNLNLVTSNILKYFNSEYENIDGNIVCFDENNHKYSLFDIVGQSDKFILRIPSLDCTPCLEKLWQDIPQMKQSIEHNVWENTIILLAMDNPRDIIFFKKEHDFPAKIYATKYLLPVSQLEATELPPYYYMIINKDMRASNCYAPVWELSSVNEAYIEAINRYFRR